MTRNEIQPVTKLSLVPKERNRLCLSHLHKRKPHTGACCSLRVHFQARSLSLWGGGTDRGASSEGQAWNPPSLCHPPAGDGDAIFLIFKLPMRFCILSVCHWGGGTPSMEGDPRRTHSSVVGAGACRWGGTQRSQEHLSGQRTRRDLRAQGKGLEERQWQQGRGPGMAVGESRARARRPGLPSLINDPPAQPRHHGSQGRALSRRVTSIRVTFGRGSDTSRVKFGRVTWAALSTPEGRDSSLGTNYVIVSLTSFSHKTQNNTYSSRSLWRINQVIKSPDTLHAVSAL